jgi:cation:H+ antiporter
VSTLILFVLGLVLLIAGSELLVRGATRVALLAGITPLVVGLTVVAFATSSPELAVCIQAARAGNSGLAVGNVVGSNILNVLLILGSAAVISPLAVAQKIIRLDVPLMIAVSALLYALALDGSIQWYEGALLAAGGLAYTVFSIVQSRRETAEVNLDYSQEFHAPTPDGNRRVLLAQQLLLVGLGLSLLVLGARWMVDGAVVFARALGVSDLLIGLTIVSVGTSLPEIATTVVASLRGERDVAVGNVIGSNLFNIFFVLGLTAVLTSGGIPVARGALSFDLPVMIAVAVACLPVFFVGGRIARWEGAMFLGYYAAYTAWLALTASRHALRPAFGGAMMYFVIPLTAVTLLVLAFRTHRANRKA